LGVGEELILDREASGVIDSALLDTLIDCIRLNPSLKEFVSFVLNSYIALKILIINNLPILSSCSGLVVTPRLRAASLPFYAFVLCSSAGVVQKWCGSTT
jgi:hypothetical protein